MRGFFDISQARKMNANEVYNMEKWFSRDLPKTTFKEDEIQRQYIKVFSRRRLLKRKIAEYSESFTIHGLSKIVNGNKCEKVLWSSILICAMFAVLYVTYGFIRKYLSHAIYIDMHTVTDEKALYPSVTFCLSNYLRSYKSVFCGYPFFQHPQGDSLCKERNLSHSMKLPYMYRLDTIWNNGVFYFTDCYADAACGRKKYFKTIEDTNGACVTWNWNNTLFQIYHKATLEFEILADVFDKFSHTPTIDVIVHHHEINGAFQNPQLQIIPGLTYHLNVQKSVTKRLPAPFPSNCSDEKPTENFPGKYNRHTCMTLDFDVQTFKNCGGIRDFSQNYLPLMSTEHDQRNINDITSCFFEYDINHNEVDCPVACNETNYEVTSFVVPLTHPPSTPNMHAYSIEIGYQIPDSYQVMEEKELYPWDKFASDFGGLIGLLIGASLFSLVEIFAYVVLIWLRYCT